MGADSRHVSCREKLGIDFVNFYIETPLPQTKLFQICLDKGYLPKDFDWEHSDLVGYTHSVIETDEFTPLELHIARAFEWDRINCATLEKCKKIASMHGLTLEQVQEWRKNTRLKCGINVV